MSSNRERLLLSEICSDVSYGYTESANAESIGPKFLRITDIQGGTIDWDAVPYCPASDSVVEKYKLESGDIVVARTGNSTGENAQIGENPPVSVFASYLIRFRPDSNLVNPHYVGYQLRSDRFKQHVLAVRGGSAQPGANAKQLGSFSLQIIPRYRQDSAVKILKAIDQRINLLRETNATLESIAQAIFKSWFVDFDPVKAKQEGRSPEGMDEETAALFPDNFEESELGMVPRGWKISTLGECTTYLNRGISPKYLETGGVLVINQKCVRDFAVELAKARRHDHSQRRIDGRELQAGDVLVNSTGVGTLGRVAQIITLDQLAIVDSHVTVVRASKEVGWNYLGQFLMRKQPEIADLGEGTTGQTELSRGKLSSLKMVVPSREILVCFDSITKPLRLRIAANFDQAKILADLRDTLLPRLITGKLRLPESEDLIEEFV